jgi:hypothetical protein
MHGLSQICMLTSTLSSEVVFIIVFFAAFPLILEREISSLNKQMKIDTFIFNTKTCNKQCIQRSAPEALLRYISITLHYDFCVIS